MDLSRKMTAYSYFRLSMLAQQQCGATELMRFTAIRDFLEQSNQEYVVMSDCNNVLSLDYEALFDAHEKSNADITIVGVKAPMPEGISSIICFDKVEKDGKSPK